MESKWRFPLLRGVAAGRGVWLLGTITQQPHTPRFALPLSRGENNNKIAKRFY
jgi:hypothetical protein